MGICKALDNGNKALVNGHTVELDNGPHVIL